MQFLVREPSVRPSAKLGESATTPPAEAMARPHGIGQRVRIRPMGWDLVASTDGLAPAPLPSRCVLTLEVEPDPANWLRTVVT